MACADTLDDSRERLRDGFVVVGTVVGLRVTGVGSYCHTPQLCMARDAPKPKTLCIIGDATPPAATRKCPAQFGMGAVFSLSPPKLKDPTTPWF